MRLSAEAAATLDFPRIRERLTGACATPPGRDLARAAGPVSGVDTIRAALAETSEARTLLAAGQRPDIGFTDDPAGPLARLAIEGEVLDVLEVRSVVRLCAAAAAARRALRGRGADLPLLAARASEIPDLAAIPAAIEPHIGPSGELLDTASPELARLRRRTRVLAAEVREQLIRIARKAGESGALQDDFITERGGRFVLPVRSDSPSRPRGVVHGASSSGATLFVEPLETVDRNNELVALRDLEAAEIERILRSWSERLAGRREEIAAAGERLGGIDLALARASLAEQMRAVPPVIQPGGALRLAGARHPVLEETLAPSGLPVVPLTLALEPGDRTLVISGPNTGGKTVALKTVGLLSVMAASGLHVPAESCALPEWSALLVDIGDHQSIAASLSTFSSHIANIAEMLRDLPAATLVLLDELGTGTDPAEGAALAIALLERFAGSGATTLVTTHHGAVKEWAMGVPGVASAAVEFDEGRLAPTYRLTMGVAGASAGLSIAERLGLDPAVIAAARARVAPAALEIDALLSRLRGLLAAARSDAAALERERSELARRRSVLELAWERQEAKRKEEFERAGMAAIEEFRRISQRLVSTVADRKERLKLEKERARQEASLKQAIAAELLRAPVAGGGRSGGEGAGSPAAVRAGEHVRVVSLGSTGVVEETGDGWASVRIGAARVRVKHSDLRPASSGPGLEEAAGWKKAARSGGRRSARPAGDSEKAAASEIVLIGQRVEEALLALDRFLDEAFVAGEREVRIVHGHGSGRLRAGVQDFLRAHPHVASQRPGDSSEGGSGATVARLRV